jgi:hypothetical protein
VIERVTDEPSESDAKVVSSATETERTDPAAADRTEPDDDLATEDATTDGNDQSIAVESTDFEIEDDGLPEVNLDEANPENARDLFE